MAETSKYHHKDGLYFMRNKDNSVTIRQMHTHKDKDGIAFQVTINNSEWASIISSVSNNNETNHEGALKFHND